LLIATEKGSIRFPVGTEDIYSRDVMSAVADNTFFSGIIKNRKYFFCVGSYLVEFYEQQGFLQAVDDYEFIDAIQIIKEQILLVKNYGIDFNIALATQGVAINFNGNRIQEIEGLRISSSESMSGWWIFPAGYKYGEPDFDHFSVISVNSLVKNYPQVARFLSLDIDCRFLTIPEYVKCGDTLRT
jgi:hypothetical protein